MNGQCYKKVNSVGYCETKVKALTIVFPVVMYGYYHWTIKKAKHWRINAFELWCCRRPLRVPWTARRSNQSISKEINPDYSLEGLMLKLKLQYFCHLMGGEPTHWKRPWCWEGLKAGEEEDNRGGDGCMASPSQWTWVWVSSGRWWVTGRPGMLQFMGSQRVGHDWVTEQQQLWDKVKINKQSTISQFYLSVCLSWEVMCLQERQRQCVNIVKGVKLMIRFQASFQIKKTEIQCF